VQVSRIVQSPWSVKQPDTPGVDVQSVVVVVEVLDVVVVVLGAMVEVVASVEVLVVLLVDVVDCSVDVVLLGGSVEVVDATVVEVEEVTVVEVVVVLPPGSSSGAQTRRLPRTTTSWSPNWSRTDNVCRSRRQRAR
jgi:hypothetical protein